jgi:hypothetical protein
VAFTLGACSYHPTALEIPKEAVSVRQFAFLSGNAYQTDFTLEATYPSMPVLEFYRERIGKPWVLCDWTGPEWSHFVDAQGGEERSVHQHLYMWVNPTEARTLMLSMRYYSAKRVEVAPDNTQQRIILVEYFHADVADFIKRLNLKCPGS